MSQLFEAHVDIVLQHYEPRVHADLAVANLRLLAAQLFQEQETELEAEVRKDAIAQIDSVELEDILVIEVRLELLIKHQLLLYC